MSSDKVPDAIKKVVSARAKDYCEYCRSPGQFATQSFTVEHIKPRQAGGDRAISPRSAIAASFYLG